MSNKVFYQHPNLMRALGMHETVMEVMVNVLGGDKSQVAPPTNCSPLPIGRGTGFSAFMNGINAHIVHHSLP